VVTAANVNDTTMFQAVVDDLAPVRIQPGDGAPDRVRSTPTRL
jgi:hypothetical protein